MLHACVRRFDVTDTVQIFLETKQGLRYPYFLGHGSTSNKLLLTRITTHNISKDMIVVHLDQLANLRGSFLLFF